MKAGYGIRETNKCWGTEIKNIVTDVPVVDDFTTFVSEDHGVRDDAPWNRIILECRV